MKRITICLPPELAQWLVGYAGIREISRSPAISDILLEKRASLAREARELKPLQGLARRISRSLRT